jgi:hypothetical protein
LEEARTHFRRFILANKLFVAILDKEIALWRMWRSCRRGSASGVGRAMMQHAFDCCRAAGCYKLRLSSNVRRERAHRSFVV